jgi:hypothetical protein
MTMTDKLKLKIATACFESKIDRRGERKWLIARMQNMFRGEVKSEDRNANRDSYADAEIGQIVNKLADSQTGLPVEVLGS